MSEEAIPETDPAEAFEAVQQELSMLEIAIKGLIAEHKNAPDYTASLAAISEWQKEINVRLYNIENSKALALSPIEQAKEMIAASQSARDRDQRMIWDARDALTCSLGQVDAMVARGQAVEGRARRERWVAAGGVLAGILLWSVLPGAIVRSLPESWHAPEWMAARTMGMEAEAAGLRMIEAAEADGR